MAVSDRSGAASARRVAGKATRIKVVKYVVQVVKIVLL